MKKFCFIALFLCTVFILCPAQAFAADTADPAAMPPVYETDALVIGSVSVTLTAPKVGAYPDYTTELPSDVKYYSDSYTTGNYKNDIVWYDLTANSTVVPGEDKFAAGHTYRVTVYLTAQSGNAFNKSTTAKLNGNAANCSVTRAGQLKVEYTFPALPELISAVSVKLTAPVAGAKPDYNPVLPDGARYYSGNSLYDSWYQNDVSWYDTAKYAFLTPGSDKFAAGTSYRVIVFLTAMDGYVFSETASATVNGKAAEECRIVDGKLRVKYTFPAAPKAITSVDLFDRYVPHVDFRPSYDSYVPNDAHYHPFTGDHQSISKQYTRNGISWYYWDDYGHMIEVDPKSETRFESGRRYGVRYYLEEDDGYAFADLMNLTVRAFHENAGAAFVSAPNIIVVVKELTMPVVLDAASVMITPPKAGELPDFTPKFPAGAKYHVYTGMDNWLKKNGVTWEVAWEDRGEHHTYLEPGVDEIRMGFVCTVYITIEAEDGYVFKVENPMFVNGEYAERGGIIGPGYPDGPVLQIVYTFPTPGDVNGDNKVNRLDYVILSRYLAGWPGYASKITDMSRAELDGKPGITAADRRILGRIVAGKS